MAERLTNDDIIKALLDAAFSRSTGGTSLANVADELHIKKASLYNHFNSRDDLIYQTTRSCGEYLEAINFIPSDYEAVTRKYPADTVLKGMVTRFLKMYEKSPLFQIYTFIESQKYFSTEAASISKRAKAKTVSQTETILRSLIQSKKIKLAEDKIHSAAVWFCSGMNDLLNQYLLDRKELVMKNPQTGDGELFSIEPDEKAVEKINILVQDFVSLVS